MRGVIEFTSRIRFTPALAAGSSLGVVGWVEKYLRSSQVEQ